MLKRLCLQVPGGTLLEAQCHRKLSMLVPGDKNEGIVPGGTLQEHV